ncbi:DUF4350 domain-containing protein [soil metagenome]
MTGGRWRKLALWGSLVVIVTLVSALIAGLRGPSGLPLDPDNPEDGGLQAIARVLEQRGVSVEVVRDLDALLSTTVDGSTTVLVVGTAYLSTDSGAQLMEHVARADSLLVLDPQPNTGEALDLPVTVSSRASSSRLGPECEVDTWREGDRIVRADQLVEVTGERDGATTCFPPSPGYNAGGAMAGYVVELAADDPRPRTVLLGIASALTNGQIEQEANAATGLRLLGGTERLVWYIPSIGDAGEVAPQSLTDVLPRAVVPSVVVLVAALGATMVWRGRRLGPVVTEPLPAVVRSVETTQSRSRMYRRAQDRRRALASLQLAARRRLAVRLGLSARAAPDAVVRATARASGRHTEEIARLLVDPAAQDDETLVRIAREVRSLEEGIRST